MYVGMVNIVSYGASEAVVCWQVEVAEGKQARQRDRNEKKQAQQAERAEKKAAEKAEKERLGYFINLHSNGMPTLSVLIGRTRFGTPASSLPP